MEVRLEKPIKKWKLVKVSVLGPFGITNFYTQKSVFTIGKKGYADIAVDFKFIEDIHIQVEIKSHKRIFITDLSTSRGTYLSRKKVEATTPTKYLLGSEIGLAGLSQAVSLSLLNEAENSHSEYVLKLAEASEIYKDACVNSQTKLNEAKQEIIELKNEAFKEIENDKIKMSDELDELKLQTQSFIELRKEEEEKKHEKLVKKHTKQGHKLKSKANRLEELIEQQKISKIKLEKDITVQNHELQNKKDFLTDLNKKISFLKESFEEDKRNISKTLNQIGQKKNDDEKRYKKSINELEGQIDTLKKKKEDIKQALFKGQNHHKVKNKEIKELEKKISKSKKEYDLLTKEINSANDKIIIATKKAADIEASATDIIDKAKDQALVILNSAQNESKKVIKELVTLTKDQSDCVIENANLSAESLIQKTHKQTDLIKNKTREEIDQLSERKVNIELSIKELEEDLILKNENIKILEAEFEDKKMFMQNKFQSIQEKIDRDKDESLTNIEKLRGHMTYKYEHEKRILQEKLDALNLNFLKVSSKKKIQEILKYIIPSATTLVLTIVIGQFFMKKDLTRMPASHKMIKDISYREVSTQSQMKKFKSGLKNILKNDLSLNEMKVRQIEALELSLLNSYNKKTFNIEKLESLKTDANKKIRSILKFNFDHYMNKKSDLIENL